MKPGSLDKQQPVMARTAFNRAMHRNANATSFGFTFSNHHSNPQNALAGMLLEEKRQLLERKLHAT